MAAAAAILPWVTIAVQDAPEAVAFFKALFALRQKYPALTPDQIMTLVQQGTGQADPGFDAVLAKIAADQKAA